MKKEKVTFTDEEIKAIERELSAGHNVEIFNCDKGTIIKRIRRETIKPNTEPVKK
jgi:hypothetical protein